MREGSTSLLASMMSWTFAPVFLAMTLTVSPLATV